jgi:hypothetical protein
LGQNIITNEIFGSAKLARGLGGFMFLEYVALFMLVFVALVMFYGIIAIHDIPYEIAVKRNHPHQDVLHVAGWVSLFTTQGVFRRYEAIFDRGAISASDLATRRQAYLADEAALTRAEADFERAQIAFESSIDGDNPDVELAELLVSGSLTGAAGD